MTAEQRRLAILRDPYVFIQAIRSSTDEDSIIAVPDTHEGYWVDVVIGSYLLPRKLIRMSPEEAVSAGATHVVLEHFRLRDNSKDVVTTGGLSPKE